MSVSRWNSPDSDRRIRTNRWRIATDAGRLTLPQQAVQRRPTCFRWRVPTIHQVQVVPFNSDVVEQDTGRAGFSWPAISNRIFCETIHKRIRARGAAARRKVVNPAFRMTTQEQTLLAQSEKRVPPVTTDFRHRSKRRAVGDRDSRRAVTECDCSTGKMPELNATDQASRTLSMWIPYQACCSSLGLSRSKSETKQTSSMPTSHI